MTPVGAAGTFPFVITVNGMTHTTSESMVVSELAPKITSIEPTSASPVLKTDIIINGSGFGTEGNIRICLLDKATMEEVDPWKLAVVTRTDTRIVAVLSGGHVGVYIVKVSANNGASNQDIEFRYEILVNEVSANRGTRLGGQTLVLSGKHFSTKNADNQVWIGDDHCTVTHSTST
jgi:hypothetical protein